MLMTSEQLLNLVVSLILEIVACGGFWTFVISKRDKKSNKTKLLIGLGHDRIMSLCLKYIDRGNITSDEYENLHDYLYQPFIDMVPPEESGTIRRVMDQVKKLDIITDGRKGGDK